MAAYSAIACFKQTLTQLLDSDELHLPSLMPQIQYLYENVSFLQSSLDKIFFVPKGKRIDMNKLQIKIRDAIYAAQDEVEYSIKSQKSDETNSLKEIADNLNLVAMEAEAMAYEIRNDPHADRLFSESTSQPTKFSSRGKDTIADDRWKYEIVGQEEDFKTVMTLLKSKDKQRLVIPITGMPGLGKTTLARSIYEDNKMKAQFDIRAWVSVSQDYTFQEIFSKILNSMESKNYQAGHYATQGDEQALFNKTHQELYYLKYLIVVDDVWDTRAWDRILMAFPDKENGSRILVTSRITKLVECIQKSGYIHTMKPLGLEDSWKLLCHKIFGDTVEANSPPQGKNDSITEACPPHLRDTGRSIAKKCEGLPLSLTVVGGLLLQERERVEYWKRIEEDTADALAKGEDSYFAILSLSYNYLPGKLKGCFLYLGAFPADCEIRVSKLIKLWVAEGFLTLPPSDPGLELKAEEYLEDLVGRDLIAIRRKSSNGGMKVCGMHRSLRDLAEKESGIEKFFHCRKKHSQEPEENMMDQRRVSIHNNLLLSLQQVYDSTKSIKDARSLLYVGPHHHHPLPFCLTFDLLRVLDAFTIYFIHFPNVFLQLFHLTYLALTYNHDLPSKISQLQKLQTLMVRREPKIIFVGVSFLPDEIWEMPQLRHLWLTETDFPALPPSLPEVALLLNLQTLANVDAAYFTDEVLDNMPNLKKLAMWIEAPDKINFNVSRLKLLEHFKFVVLNPVPGKGIEVEAEQFFPKTLKRVTLSGCGLPWEYMEYVAENLVDLQVLKLKELAFYGDEWILGDFKLKALKYLLMEYLTFQIWDAESFNFPKLKRLVLRHCYELEEIPRDLGYIGPLEQIEMVDCSPTAMESANDIMNDQEDFKPDFQVRIFSSLK